MWPFKRRLTDAEVARVIAASTEKAQVKMRQEEVLFDRYMKMPHRPVKSGWIRMTEVSPSYMCHDLVDWDHYRQWKNELCELEKQNNKR